MSELILQTKLNIPQNRPSLIARPHLVAELNGGLSGKLSLVSAPPGFGKTTLVAEWIQQLPPEQEVAWLSLDKGDNDPTHFFAYLIAALQTINAGIGQDLTVAQLPPPEAVMGSLINDITAVSQAIVLVLDDYHVLIEPAVHQALMYLVEHMPGHMHLVIISRADPPFSLSRLRVRRQLTEIRARDCRFSTEEAARFLLESMALDLSMPEVTLLEKRTEGWVAGLQLAAHSLRHEEDKLAFLTAFAGDDRYIADYLVEEVLNHQPPEIQTFLLHTAILDRLNHELCDAVLQRQDSQALLEYLEQANLFLFALDNRRQWYRYHHLFAELLQERLETLPDEAPRLHLRASQWYADNDFLPQAVAHALSAADYDRAVNLIYRSVISLFSSNQLLTLLTWWKQLPPEMTAQNPQLCMIFAWAFLATSQWPKAEECLLLIEAALGASMGQLLTEIDTLEPRTRNALIEVAAIRVTYQSQIEDDTVQTLLLCRRMLPYLEHNEDPFLFNQPAALYPVVSFNLGLAHRTLNQFDEALQAFEEAINLGTIQGNGHIVGPAITRVAAIEIIRGQLGKAADTCRRGIDLLATMAGKISPTSGALHIILGQLFYQWNQLHKSAQFLKEGILLAEPWQIKETLIAGYLGMVHTASALGQKEAARAAQTAFTAYAASEPGPAGRLAAAYHARLLAEQGNMEPAREWLQVQGRGLDERSFGAEEALLEIHLRLLLGENKALNEPLVELLEAAEADQRWGQVLELLVMQALSLAAQGEQSQALSALTRALHLAAAEGYVRIFVDEGRPMAMLLQELNGRELMPVYGQQVLAAWPAKGLANEDRQEKVASGPSPTLAPKSLLDPLTDRELEILRLIAQGLGNREIAVRLYLTLGTVKGHAHHIFSKLDVNSRTQAVAKARALNIIP